MSGAEFGSYIHKIFEEGVGKSIEDLIALSKSLRSNYKFSGRYNEALTNKCIANFYEFNKKLGKSVGEETVYEVSICEKTKIKHNGIIDRIVEGREGGYLVIDYKTSKREKSKIDLYNDAQLQGYAYAVHKIYGVPFNKIWCAHYYPISNTLVSVQFSQTQMNAFVRKFIEQVWTIRKKKAGEYPAIRNEFCDWCSYKSLCPKFRTGPQIQQRLDEIKSSKEDQ